MCESQVPPWVLSAANDPDVLLNLANFLEHSSQGDTLWKKFAADEILAGNPDWVLVMQQIMSTPETTAQLEILVQGTQAELSAEA